MLRSFQKAWGNREVEFIRIFQAANHQFSPSSDGGF